MEYQGYKVLAELIQAEKQINFSAKTGVDPAMVNRHWLPGNGRPSMKTIEKIADKLSLPISKVVSVLYGEDGK